MVFSSLLFVFAFFALQMIVYLLVDDEKKNKVLLGFSLVFYAWGGPRYILLLLIDTFASWFFALQIHRHKRKSDKKLFLFGECLVVLGLLFIFKYTTFVAGTTHALFGIPKVVPNIVLPIGISFYTFQLLSYVIDVYRGHVAPQKHFWKLLLYSSLFHQCIAGPIVRYETVANEIDHRKVNLNDIYYGVRRFSIGLAKKALLANGCASVADTLLPSGLEAIHAQSVVGLWFGLLFYTLQIYLDFSAYSDMAIGMGRMVGFHYLENFNYPYLANSVQDFWRRWHISLSTFFRDYVYIPLGGSRVDKNTLIRNMLVVWLLTGLWHGASWNYVLWGLYFFVFLYLERFVFRMKRWSSVRRHIYAFIAVYFGWLLFRHENMSEGMAVLLGMFGIGANGFFDMGTRSLLLSNCFFLPISLLACTPVSKYLHTALHYGAKKNNLVFMIYNATEVIIPPLLLILAVLALIGDSYNPFLYFQF